MVGCRLLELNVELQPGSSELNAVFVSPILTIHRSTLSLQL